VPRRGMGVGLSGLHDGSGNRPTCAIIGMIANRKPAAVT
jgi:hypothetical protein